MSSWEMTPLGDVADVVPGFAFKSKDWCDEGVPVLKIKNITGDGSVDTSDADCVPSAINTDRMMRYRLGFGDILIAMTGATAGKVGIIRSHGLFLLNQRVAKLVPTDVDAGYFWSVVRSEEYEKLFFRLADGAAQPNMSGSQIERLPIPVPPLKTQQRIAAILGAYDDLIEVNRRRVAVLEEMAQGLFEEWFVRFRFPGHEDVALVDSPDSPLPEGWERRKFGDIAENYDRLRKPLSGKVRSTMQGPFPYYGAAKIFDYIDDYLFDGRYLLVAEDGSVITKDGFPMLQLVDGKFWVNNHAHVVRGSENVTTEFLYLALQRHPIQGYITGAAQPKITQGNLNRIPVVVGDDDTMEHFCQLVGHIFDLVWNLTLAANQLAASRDLLLPRLISGQLSVEAAERQLEDAA